MTLREQIAAASAPMLMECVENGVWQIRLVFGKGDEACHAMRRWADAYRAGKLLVIEDEQEAVRDMLAAALVALTRKGFRADQLECLTHGNGRGTIPPRALEHALTAALAALRGDKA